MINDVIQSLLVRMVAKLLTVSPGKLVKLILSQVILKQTLLEVVDGGSGMEVVRSSLRR